MIWGSGEREAQQQWCCHVVGFFVGGMARKLRVQYSGRI